MLFIPENAFENGVQLSSLSKPQSVKTANDLQTWDKWNEIILEK